MFFGEPENAEAAGYRACKRCRPREDALPSSVELAQQTCCYIEEHHEERITLTDLGEHVHVSPYHLQRVFKRVMGITPRQYAEARRLEKVKAQMRGGETVTQALYGAGYGSSSRLYEQAANQLGMTPSVYKRGGKDMRIGYTIVDTPLGRLLVGATEKGVCAVSLGDSDAYLEAALRREYPAAEITGDGVDVQREAQALLEYLGGKLPHLDLPVDVQATAFQWRVWQALQSIPYGATRSYNEVAQAIGNPKATRAVAHACATNPVAIIIPCHRVVRTNGALGGYRWGLERKQQLLAQEADVAAVAAPSS